ncbi:MarR family winged helix-turn-helix transcriptional regulator [Cellulomonas fimi]|uniref:Regulatory protein MarR n=1 Tax=Cellulomonas fimi (strain ATCC 484 / DSM 20113 / JCM 1341 / CCUG 24087 / LMG 16345 / NBRC 15513 / NCIMB 8980 / NCTC 7547 / NRS-133) TaxID=590998 RepID=F4H050_CELFA|nr:MarR family winged helix-turn-helix transcriptional regulator [Cellulomonas fimi]AEE44972.1 regulatory protein MarR [Cellulomonas fimi ATCC 484]NNH07203.1 winged helix-turn-helix transcriptional regulator [Cellulomonas fimi]VEH27843.1 DNA-binding transcriptional repressor MarR [Cellulomonas fimi]
MTEENLARLEQELGLLLRRAHASQASLAREVHPDLEPSAYVLLGHIEATPGLRASDLASFIGVGRGTISRQLSRLGAIGLVSRRPDPDDFRGQLLDLTDEGRRRLASARAARREFLLRALADWSAQEIDALAERLDRLNEALAAARQHD